MKKSPMKIANEEAAEIVVNRHERGKKMKKNDNIELIKRFVEELIEDMKNKVAHLEECETCQNFHDPLQDIIPLNNKQKDTLKKIRRSKKMSEDDLDQLEADMVWDNNLPNQWQLPKKIIKKKKAVKKVAKKKKTR